MICKVVLSVMVLALGGCSLSHKKRVLFSMAASGAAGAVVGASVTPSGEKQEMHALLWASFSSAVTGAMVEGFSKDRQKEVLLREEKITSLQEQLRQLKASKQLVSKGSSLMQTKLPEDLKHLIRPGKWKRFQVDRWVKDPENRGIWYHQDQMFQLQLPSLNH